MQIDFILELSPEEFKVLKQAVKNFLLMDSQSEENIYFCKKILEKTGV